MKSVFTEKLGVLLSIPRLTVEQEGGGLEPELLGNQPLSQATLFSMFEEKDGSSWPLLFLVGKWGEKS